MLLHVDGEFLLELLFPLTCVSADGLCRHLKRLMLTCHLILQASHFFAQLILQGRDFFAKTVNLCIPLRDLFFEPFLLGRLFYRRSDSRRQARVDGFAYPIGDLVS